MKKLLPACLGFTLLFFTGVSQAQTTVSLTPTQDNTLFQSASGTVSGGADDNIFAGKTNNGGIRRAVLKFNLASIPAGATITSATLTMNMNLTISGSQAVSLHKLSANWGEGTSTSGSGGGGGGAATTNSVTWLHTFYPGTNWSTPGGDYVSTASATASVAGTGSYTWSGAQFLSDVQSMFANAATNHGWIVIGNEATNGSAKRFASRENASPSNRPTLSVTYTLPCNAPTVPTVTATQTSLCTGASTNITATGTLNSATAWHLYSGSCGGTPVASNTTGIFTVSPSATTTYFVRGQGSCVTPGACGQVTVTVQPNQSAAFSYGASSFCAGGPNAVPTITGTPGGIFSAGIVVGLFINSSTGVIDMSLTMPGTYQITYTTPGPCPASSTATVQVNAAQSAAFSYSASNYCQNAANPTPTISGNTGGTFSGTTGLVINATTGQINLLTSTSGSHTVTYTNSGACAATATAPVTISLSQSAAFSYPASSFCQGGANPTPTITGTQSGTFSSTPSGLSVNATTGQINLAASNPGTYSVTYTTPGAMCGASASVPVTVTATGNAGFSYSASTFCPGDPNPAPTITGTGGGVFSSVSGLSINATTGVINIANSMSGVYPVTYTTSGACPATSTFLVTLSPQGNAAFSYSASNYCQDATNPVPTVSGTQGGTFSHNIGIGFFLNAGTGEIDLSLTMPGTYQVTYTTPGNCPASSTVSVTVNPNITESVSASICAGATLVFGTQTLSTAGTYTETFTSAAGCDSTVTLTLSIEQINAGVTLTGQTLAANQAGATYQWVLCGNPVTPVAGATGQTFSPTVTGQYAVQVTQNNCTAMSVCTSVIINSAEETLANAVKLYPNPAMDKAVLELPSVTGKLEVQLINTLGQTVSKQQFTAANQAEIGLSRIPAGVYLLRIEADGVLITRSLQVVN